MADPEIPDSAAIIGWTILAVIIAWVVYLLLRMAGVF